MITRTELALQALIVALEAKAAGDGPALPQIWRNEDVFARMEAAGDGVHRFLNVWDGEVAVSAEALGADLVNEIDDEEPGAGAYDIELRPRIDWICVGGAQADRDAAFDRGLIAIHDAVRGAIVDGARVYLEGRVDQATIERIARSGLATDGLAGVKACEITPLLQFTSHRPF